MPILELSDNDYNSNTLPNTKKYSKHYAKCFTHSFRVPQTSQQGRSILSLF